MTLDSEQDREILLTLIESASIAGKHVLIIADLIARIRDAKISTPEKKAAP